jgi:sulfofructose kinase
MTSPNSFDVMCVGLNAVDVLVRLPETIRPDAKHRVDDLLIMGGAPVGTGSCAIARLGYRTAFVGRLGHNTLSAISIEEFHKHGVDTSRIVRDADSRPAIALVEIDPKTAARTVFVNLDQYGFLRPEDLPADELRAARLVWVDSYDLDATENTLELLRGSQTRTLLDFESGDPARLLRLMKLGTDIVVPLECARHVTGVLDAEPALAALVREVPGQVVVTDGANGSWGWTGQGIHHQPAYRVDRIIDTTGCGDAYHAGYAAGLLEGWPLALRMELGTLIASAVLAKVGGRSALPAWSDLPSLLRPETSESLRNALTHLPSDL